MTIGDASVGAAVVDPAEPLETPGPVAAGGGPEAEPVAPALGDLDAGPDVGLAVRLAVGLGLAGRVERAGWGATLAGGSTVLVVVELSTGTGRTAR